MIQKKNGTCSREREARTYRCLRRMNTAVEIHDIVCAEVQEPKAVGGRVGEGVLNRDFNQVGYE